MGGRRRKTPQIQWKPPKLGTTFCCVACQYRYEEEDPVAKRIKKNRDIDIELDRNKGIAILNCMECGLCYKVTRNICKETEKIDIYNRWIQQWKMQYALKNLFK